MTQTMAAARDYLESPSLSHCLLIVEDARARASITTLPRSANPGWSAAPGHSLEGLQDRGGAADSSAVAAYWTAHEFV
jgi:hypothetical protein